MTKTKLRGSEHFVKTCEENNVKYVSLWENSYNINLLNSFKVSDSIKIEKCLNPRIALDCSIGSSLVGRRSLVITNTEGLNLSADSFYGLTGTRVYGGLVIVILKESDLHRCKNDFKDFIIASGFPLLSPSSIEDLNSLTSLSFKTSEDYNIPVIIEISAELLNEEAPEYEINLSSFDGKKIDMQNYSYGPKALTSTVSLIRKSPKLFKKMEKVYVDFAERSQNINKCFSRNRNNIVIKGSNTGIICSGLNANKMLEKYEGCSFFILSIIYPLPTDLLKEFASGLEEIIVIDDIHPIIFSQISSMLPEKKVSNINLVNLADNRNKHEVNISNSLKISNTKKLRKLTKIIEKHFKKWVIHTENSLTNLISNKTQVIKCHSLGAEIGIAHGLLKADEENFVTVLENKSLLHSGFNGLINVSHNNSAPTVIILNNELGMNLADFTSTLKIDNITLDIKTVSKLEQILKNRNCDKALVIILNCN